MPLEYKSRDTILYVLWNFTKSGSPFWKIPSTSAAPLLVFESFSHHTVVSFVGICGCYILRNSIYRFKH